MNIPTKRPVITFYLLAALFTVLFGMFNSTFFPITFQYCLMLPQWGPAAAAILVFLFLKQRGSIRGMFKHLLPGRGDVPYLVLAFIIPAVCCAATYIILSVKDTGGFRPPVFSRSFPNYAVCLAATFLSVTGEELGWRGFMLPELRKNYSPLAASLITGLFWGIWHFRFQSIALAVFFVILVIEFSCIITRLNSKTDNRILAGTVFHTFVNMGSLMFFENIVMGDSADTVRLNALLYGIYAAVFAVPGIISAAALLKQKNGNPKVRTGINIDEQLAL